MLKQGLFITDDARCHYMMNPGGIVWESMNALATAFRQNQTQHIHFVQYDDLVNDPEKALQGIHWFLKLKPFEYDFDNIKAKDREKIKKYMVYQQCTKLDHQLRKHQNTMKMCLVKRS